MNNAPATLVYPLDANPEPGDLLDIAPGVKWLRLPLPFLLSKSGLKLSLP